MEAQQHNWCEREQALTDALHAALMFIQNEMHWCGFRAEFLEFGAGVPVEETVSQKNCNKLIAFLQRDDLRPYVQEALKRYR